MPTHPRWRLLGEPSDLVDRSLDYEDALKVLAQAARARDEMVAIVSHDLKNPLATIQLAVNFLLDELAPHDTAHQIGRTQLNVIRRSAERMDRLVHDLLDVSAAESGQLPIACARMGVDVLVADALDLLRPLAAAKQITLVQSLDASLPQVDADRERMLQVFSNLGGNALTFTPAGGRVEFCATSRGALVEVSVIDTGAGIAAEDLPHVFDRFWRGDKKKTQSGVGLGLAIARGIVEAHGGEIRVESAPGRGTSFTFTLPAAAAAAA